MEKYNYFENVRGDIKQAILDGKYDGVIIKAMSEFDRNDFAYDETKELDIIIEDLEQAMWTDDCITGNGSGSYTFCTWTAEEYLCHNLDLLQEAFSEFGCTTADLDKGAEFCDCTIRCYLLNQCLWDLFNNSDNEMDADIRAYLEQLDA